MLPAVTVIVPTYNQSKLLEKTIDSLLSQTHAAVEIIVLDDGSSDDTSLVVSRMPSTVKYHYKANGGICSARNAGAALAQTSYVAFCDHDDLWREDKLAKQMELFDQFPGLQYSFTNFAIISDDVWASSTKFDDAPAKFFEGCRQVTTSGAVCESSMYERILRFQPIWPSTILMTTELFRELGGFEESFGRNPSEDLEFTLRCLQRGPTGIITEPVVGVRKHQANFSGSNYHNALGQIEILLYALEHHAISESTRSVILDQLALRRVDASYAAFDMEQFEACRDLLSSVPRSYINPKVRLKQIISGLSPVLSKTLHSLLVRR